MENEHARASKEAARLLGQQEEPQGAFTAIEMDGGEGEVLVPGTGSGGALPYPGASVRPSRAALIGAVGAGLGIAGLIYLYSLAGPADDDDALAVSRPQPLPGAGPQVSGYAPLLSGIVGLVGLFLALFRQAPLFASGTGAFKIDYGVRETFAALNGTGMGESPEPPIYPAPNKADFVLALIRLGSMANSSLTPLLASTPAATLPENSRSMPVPVGGNSIDVHAGQPPVKEQLPAMQTSVGMDYREEGRLSDKQSEEDASGKQVGMLAEPPLQVERYEDISATELAEMLQTIAMLPIDEASWSDADVSVDDEFDGGRTKREAALLKMSIADAKQKMLVALTGDSLYPPNVTVELKTLFDKVDQQIGIRDSQNAMRRRYGDALFSERFTMRFLKSLLHAVHEAVLSAGKSQSTLKSYHYLYTGLRQLWQLEAQIGERQKPDLTGDYRKELRKQQRSWKKPPPANSDEISRWSFENLYPALSKRGVRLESLIGAHDEQGYRQFSIATWLSSSGVPPPEGGDVHYHFIFDSTGLPDEDLDALMDEAGPERFAARKAERHYQVNEQKYSSQARALFERRLQQPQPRQQIPSGFSKTGLMQELIAEQEAQDEQDEQGALEAGGLVKALVDLGLQEHNWTQQEQIMLGAASAAIADVVSSDPLFQGMKSNDLVLAEYPYCYRDQAGEARYDIMTVAQYVAGIVEHGRTNVTMLWDDSLSEGQTKKLREQVEALNPVRQELSKSMPNILAAIAYLQEVPSIDVLLEPMYVALCDALEISQGTLSDTTVFRYTQRELVEVPSKYSFLPTSVMLPFNGVKVRFHHIDKKFSNFELALGAKRRWELHQPDWETPVVQRAPANVPKEKKNAWRDAWDSFDAQADIVGKYAQIAESEWADSAYQNWLDLIEPQDTKQSETLFEFDGNPNIAVYSKGEQVQKAWSLSSKVNLPADYVSVDPAKPLTLLMRRSGQRYDFSSLAAMHADAASDSAFAQDLRFHLGTEFERLRELPLRKLDRKLAYPARTERHLAWLGAEADKLMTSSSEALWHEIFGLIPIVAGIASVPVTLLAPPAAALLFGLFFFSGPLFAQAMIADRRDEKMGLFKAAFASVGLQFGAALTAELVAVALISSIRLAEQYGELGLRIGMRTLNTPAGRKIMEKYLVHCRKSGRRGKRGIQDALCQLNLGKKNTAVSRSSDVSRNIQQLPAVAANTALIVKYPGLLEKYAPLERMAFVQEQDFLAPALRIAKPANQENLNQGMCLALSLSVGKEALHGDRFGLQFLGFAKNIVKEGSQSGKKAANELIDILDDLHSKQPAEFSRKKINELTQEMTEHIAELDRLELTAKQQGVLPDIIQVNDIAGKMKATRARIEENRSSLQSEAWGQYEQSIKSWGQTWQMEVRSRHYTGIQASDMAATLMAELRSGPDKFIQFGPSDHAMVLIKSGEQYAVFEPNFNLAVYGNAGKLEQFLVELQKTPGYSLLPRADIFTLAGGSSQNLPKTDIRKIIEASQSH